MNLVELFCGCGGFSRGAHDAGFDVAAAYDVDPILTSSYRTNFPGTELRHRDVSTLTGDQIRSDVGGDVFGLFGGPPCQGFSEIGKRNPDDPRRELLGHFFRIVGELRPTFFVMENVRGLAHPGAKPVLDAALDMVRDEYDLVGPVIWDASNFGAATKRQRMFVIGTAKRGGRPLRLEQFEAAKRTPATVEEAIGDLRNAVEIEPCAERLMIDRWRISDNRPPSAYAAALRCEDGTFTGHRTTTHTPAVVERFAAIPAGGFERIGRHPRLDPSGQCPTLRAGTGVEKGSFQSVRPIHPEADRVITVREAARLQGFPDAHVFHPTVWHSFRMIGNSVSPIMSKAVFDVIREHFAAAETDAAQPEIVRPELPDRPAASSNVVRVRFPKAPRKTIRMAARRKRAAGR